MKTFDKYECYETAVQDPQGMAEFLDGVYQDIAGKSARVLREDFCGTFALSRQWVSADKKRKAVVVDNNAEPLEAGRAHEFPHEAVEILCEDVLKPLSESKADILCALNFSYGIFKTRKDLARYFSTCRERLKSGGILVLDVLGGMEIANEMQTEAEFPGFRYVWEQESFDPLTRNATFHIHIRPEGGRLRKKVFSYQWRMWTVIELRELLQETGFSNSHVYWQGYGRAQDDAAFPFAGETWTAHVVGVR